MNIAIAILNWNGKAWLEKCLPNVLLHSKEASVYVIDNGSTDDSVDFITTHFPEVKVVKNTANKGFAGGYNDGLKTIQADVYCLLNSDVEVTKDWLSPIIRLFETDDDISVIQPKILDFNKRTHFEFAGAGGGFIDQLGYPYCRGRIFDDIEADNGQYNDETEIFWASGCAFFIRAKDFWREHGFDESFFAHQEEIDLCWRLKNKDKKIYYCGHSTVYHVGGGTLNKKNPQKTYLNFRNNLSMLLKNLPFPKAFYIIFIRLCLDGIAGVRFIFTDGFTHTFAIIKAHFGFYARAYATLQKRDKKQMTKYWNETFLLKYFFKR